MDGESTVMTDREKKERFLTLYRSHFGAISEKEGLSEYLRWITSRKVNYDVAIKAIGNLAEVWGKYNDAPKLRHIIKAYQETLPWYDMGEAKKGPRPDCRRCSSTGTLWTVLGKISDYDGSEERWVVARDKERAWQDVEVRRHPCECQHGFALKNEILGAPHSLTDIFSQCERWSAGLKLCFSKKSDAQRYASGLRVVTIPDAKIHSTEV